MDNQEIWKDVIGYEDIYQVSNIGNIKSLNYNRTGKEQLLVLSKDRFGYLCIHLCKQGKKRKFKVHQLVAIEFLNHIPCGHERVVDHIDTNKKNNDVSNLQILSNRENLSKDKKGYSSQYVGVAWCKSNKKWRAQMTINKKVVHLGNFNNEIDAHNAYQNRLKELV